MRHPTITTTSTLTSTSTTKRRIGLAILFVILLLPLSTNAAQSRSSSSDRDLCKGSNDAAECAKSLETRQMMAATRRAKAKFKFHKIERMDDDDGNDNNDENEAEAEENEWEDNDTEDMLNDEQSQKQGERNSAENDDNEANDDDDNNDNFEDDEEDDDDEGDGDDEGDADDEDDGDADDEDEGDDNDNDDDDEGDGDNDGDGDGDADEEPSLLSRLLAIFASDEAAAKREAKKKESESQLPNIISWFNWLTEQTTDAAAAPQKVGKQRDKAKSAKAAKASKAVDIDWLTYLKRWPFNSIFPETPEAATTTSTAKRGNAKGKQQQQQQQVERGQRAKEKEKGTTIKRERDQDREKRQDEYMELLIHSLPAFIGNVAQVKSGECHQQLELLHQQLRSHKLWTLQMLDATGKIGAGLLRGNINQFGDFDQCTQVSTAIKMPPGKPMRIHGKYCLAQIEMRATTAELKDALHLLHGRGLWNAHLKNPRHFVARYSIANWGICLPHACSAQVVHNIIETSLRAYNDTGIQFHIDVRDEHCTVRRKKSFSRLLSNYNNFAMGIFGIGALVCACVLSSVWQHWDWLSSKLTSKTETETDDGERTEQVQEQEEERKPAVEKQQEIAPQLHLRILQAFSPQRTWQSLVSLDAQDVEFPLIHLLKILATLMIYVNLKFIMAGHLPITNRDDFVVTVNRQWSPVYRLPLLYSDLLLLLSGFLVAHQLSHQMEATCRLSFVRNVATKACRYVPSILAVLGFQTWILPHLGAGPLWQLLVGENARLCEENMWRAALSVQNTADMEDMCSPFTVQLSLDLQLYFLGALVIWLYFTDPEAGFFLCGAFNAMSVAARYSRTQREHLAPSLFHGIQCVIIPLVVPYANGISFMTATQSVSKFYRTANQIYTSPITRASAYLLGIGAALLFHSESGIFRIPTRFKRAGWALALLALVWCFWSPDAGLRSKYVYKTADAAAYLAWSPLVLGLGIGWAILMVPLDKSIVKRFPNVARPLLLLSRLEIPLQLASYMVVLWTTASVKEPHQFLMSNLINLQEVACIVLFAIIVAFLIDFPAQEIGLLILDFNFSDPPLTPSKQKDGAVDKASAEDDAELKSDSPEPTDSIWPSESDPEDEKSSE